MNSICRSLRFLELRHEEQISNVPLRQERLLLLQDNDTGKQGTLGTSDKGEAQWLVNARNESCNSPAAAINLQIARAYLNAADPGLITRTWQKVMEALVVLKRGTNRLRWDRAILDHSFDCIRRLFLIETRSDQFLKVLWVADGCCQPHCRRCEPERPNDLLPA